jgi:hypothetical protein
LTFAAISQNQLEISGLAKDTLEPKAGEPDIWLYCDAELTICALNGGQCASLDDEYSVTLTPLCILEQSEKTFNILFAKCILFVEFNDMAATAIRELILTYFCEMM